MAPRLSVIPANSGNDEFGSTPAREGGVKLRAGRGGLGLERGQPFLVEPGQSEMGRGSDGAGRGPGQGAFLLRA